MCGVQRQRRAVRIFESHLVYSADIQQSLLPKGMQLSEYLKLAKEALTQDVRSHIAQILIARVRMSQGRSLHTTSLAQRTTARSTSLGASSLQTHRSQLVTKPMPTTCIRFSSLSVELGDEALSYAQVRGSLPLQRVRDGRHLLGQYLDLLVEQKERLREENVKLLKHNEAFMAEKQRSAALVQFSIAIRNSVDAMVQLDKLLEEKKALERDLYTKVCHLCLLRLLTHYNAVCNCTQRKEA